MKKSVALLLIFGLLASFVPRDLFAVRIKFASYSVMPASAGTAANHLLVFQTATEISSGTIKLHLKNLISSMGSVGVSDIDVSYGTSVAGSRQNQLTLASSAGNATWGAEVSVGAKTLTLTYPNSGSASIPAQSYVAVAIGTIAYSQSTGSNRMTNAATAGAKDIAVYLGSDSHLLSVGLSASATSSASATLQSAPTAPTGLTLTSGTGGVSTYQNRVDVSWTDASSNEDSFSIERKTGSDSFAVVASLSANATSYSNENLTAQTTYVYRVRAINSIRNSDYSSELTVTTASAPAVSMPVPIAPPAPNPIAAPTQTPAPSPTPAPTPSQTPTPTATPTTPAKQSESSKSSVSKKSEETPKAPLPVVPSGFKAEYSALENRVNLSWKSDSKNISKLSLERKVGKGEYARISSELLGKTEYGDAQIAPRTSYAYRLVGENSLGAFVYSVESVLTTPSPVLPPPAQPSNLTALSDGKTVALSWIDQASNETEFELERRTLPGAEFSLIKKIPANFSKEPLTASDKDVTQNTRYAYRVRAVNEGGESIYSNEVTIAVSPPPAKLSPVRLSAVFSAATKTVTLSWSATQNQGVRNQLLRRVMPENQYSRVIELDKNPLVSVNTQSGQHSYQEILEESKEYRFLIRTISDGSVDSNEVVIATTPPPAPKPAVPEDVTAIADSYQRATVSWTDLSNNETAFEIQRIPRFPQNVSDATGSLVIAANAVSYRDLNVEPETRYRYRVRSVNESIKGTDENFSGWVSVQTPAAPPPPPPPPPAPQSIKAEALSSDEIELSWDTVTDPNVVYHIERKSEHEVDFTPIVSVPGTTSDFVDTTADENTDYTYRVVAENTGGKSIPASSPAVETPTELFDKKQVVIATAPPAVEKTITAKSGGTLDTSSKNGSRVGVSVPAGVKAFVEGEKSASPEKKVDSAKAVTTLLDLLSVPVTARTESKKPRIVEDDKESEVIHKRILEKVEEAVQKKIDEQKNSTEDKPFEVARLSDDKKSDLASAVLKAVSQTVRTIEVEQETVKAVQALTDIQKTSEEAKEARKDTNIGALSQTVSKMIDQSTTLSVAADRTRGFDKEAVKSLDKEVKELESKKAELKTVAKILQENEEKAGKPSTSEQIEKAVSTLSQVRKESQDVVNVLLGRKEDDKPVTRVLREQIALVKESSQAEIAQDSLVTALENFELVKTISTFNKKVEEHTSVGKALRERGDLIAQLEKEAVKNALASEKAVTRMQQEVAALKTIATAVSQTAAETQSLLPKKAEDDNALQQVAQEKIVRVSTAQARLSDSSKKGDQPTKTAPTAQELKAFADDLITETTQLTSALQEVTNLADERSLKSLEKEVLAAVKEVVSSSREEIKQTKATDAAFSTSDTFETDTKKEPTHEANRLQYETVVQQLDAILVKPIESERILQITETIKIAHEKMQTDNAELMSRVVQSQPTIPPRLSYAASPSSIDSSVFAQRLEDTLAVVSASAPALKKFIVTSERSRAFLVSEGLASSTDDTVDAGTLAIESEQPIHFFIESWSPSPSSVTSKFGSSDIIDKKPVEFKRADGVGPIHVIGAQKQNTQMQSSRKSVVPVSAKPSLSRRIADAVLSFVRSFFINGAPVFAQASQEADVVSPFPPDQEELPLTTFEPSLTYTFTYTDEEIVNVDESTVKLYSWDVANEAWVIEHGELNADRNTFSAQLNHLSIFRLFGEAFGIPPSEKKDVIIVPQTALRALEDEISADELVVTKTEAKEAVPISRKKFYTTAKTEIDMCIPAKIFKKSVKKIVLSVGSKNHSLLYSKKGDCFGTRITTPESRGRQDIVLKIVYVDDQIQKIRLETEITSDFEAQVLATVVPAVQQIGEVAVKVNTEVKKTVEGSQPVLQTAAIATVPVVTVANPAILSNTLNLWNYLTHFISWLLSLLGLRRGRKAAWGVVYDSITKNPLDLAIVRLFDAQTQKLLDTQVTDKQGRFSFLVAKGTYSITATKLPMVFPSRLVTSSSDGPYTNVYLNGSLTLSDPEKPITISIPLDPPEGTQLKTSLNFMGAVRQILEKSSKVSLVASFGISIALAVYTPSTLNTVLLIVNWLYASYQVFLMLKKEKPWGIVFDALTFKPVSLAAISIFDAHEKKLLRTRLTDYAGRFTFLAPPGDYLLTVTKSAYTFPVKTQPKHSKFSHLYMGGEVHVKKQDKALKINIPIEPQSEQDSPVKARETAGVIDPLALKKPRTKARPKK